MVSEHIKNTTFSMEYRDGIPTKCMNNTIPP